MVHIGFCGQLSSYENHDLISELAASVEFLEVA